MLKTCRYCGIVPYNHICPYKQRQGRRYKSKEERGEAERFRSTQAWNDKRVQIKERDLYLCRACLAEIFPTFQKYNSEGLEVHHIESLRESFEKRLDDDNLITLCSPHHKMADKGEIGKDELRELAAQKPAP